MSGSAKGQVVSDVNPNDSQLPPSWTQVLADSQSQTDFWDRPSGDWGNSSTAVGATHASGYGDRRRDANSAYRLGTKALRREDLPTARLWFEIASEQEHPGAAFRLTAVHLREHRQTPQDAQLLVISAPMGGGKTTAFMAVEWLFRAARWGHGDAARLTVVAERLRTAGLGRGRAEEAFLAETRLEDAGQDAVPGAGGTESGRGHAQEDTEFYDEVREHIFLPLVASLGRERLEPQRSTSPVPPRADLALSRRLTSIGDGIAASLARSDEAEEVLREVAGAGSAPRPRPAFRAAMAATGTDAYAAIQQLVQYANPSAGTSLEDRDLYGVAFIGTSAAPPSDITTDGTAPGRRKGTARLRVVRQPDRTAPGPSTYAEGLEGDKRLASLGRFTLPEDSIRELLMGTQLYQDSGLAVRELYQNALDACRYRSARREYLSRTNGLSDLWQGRIEFTQGVDEQGRAFLDCVDNGIGMGEEELRTSFSRVGLRFPELPEFREEKAQWEACEPPVQMYPNSRFGIGVMSYFMLADEIDVTTCRMDPQGFPGPELKMTVPSPGQPARITRVRAQGTIPGTRVRLFLRDERNAPSCVDVLEKVLGIAEYTTTARHGDRSASWQPHELWPRKKAPRHHNVIDVRGRVVHTLAGQVVWCESGGALLADGLLVQPSVRHGVFANSRRRNALHGVVINLTGSPTPPALSVDRKQIVGDVSHEAESLVTRASRELVTTQRDFVTHHWLESMARQSPRLAEIVARAASEV